MITKQYMDTAAFTLTANYTDSNATVELDATNAARVRWFITYASGTEATGLLFIVEAQNPAGLWFPMGTDTSAAWTVTGDQTMAKSAAGSFWFTTEGGCKVRLRVKANGALGGGPGTVTRSAYAFTTA